MSDTDKLMWVNKYEHPSVTTTELDKIVEVVEKALGLCVDRKIHSAYHTAMLLCEILRRRTDYIRCVAELSEPPYVNRLTCPTSFLGTWLKYTVITKRVARGICDGRCEQLFSGSGSGRRLDDTATTYPMTAPFSCGPVRPAPGVRCTNRWTGAYEVKYAYRASRILHDELDDTVLADVLAAISCLLRVRHKTNVDYTPGVGNGLLDAARQTFYNVYESYVHRLLPS